MPSEVQLRAQRAALDVLRAGFNAAAASSDAAADAFNAVPQSERLPAVQAIVPAYNVVVEALRSTGQTILAGIAAADAAIASFPPPAPAPAPPAPPPPAPAPPAGTLVAPGNDIYDRHWNWAQDAVDTAKLPAPIPWTTFADDKLTVAPSRAGVEPRTRRRLNVYGNVNGLYDSTPALVDGAIRPIYPQVGDDPTTMILPSLHSYPLRAGARGVGIMTPYCTWHGHDRITTDGTPSLSDKVPMWVGIVMDGRIAYAFRDGSVQYPFQVPLKSYSNDFSFHEPRTRQVFFVTDTGAGEIVMVTRTTPPQFFPGYARGLGMATSCRSVGDALYVADNAGGRVLAVEVTEQSIAARAGAVREVCKLAGVFWLDYTSDGNLVAMTTYRAIHKIDTKTGAIGPNLAPTIAAGPNEWVVCDVDRKGTCGERDAICLISSHGVANVDFYRITSQGLTTPGTGYGVADVGTVDTCEDGYGHYPWVVTHHPDDGCMLVQGFSNAQPSVIACGDALPDEYDHNLMRAGRESIRTGTPEGWANWGSLPSFTALMNANGGSFLGCTADYVASMPFADAARFIQAGMSGSVPRPAFKGAALLPIMYALYRNSQRFLREGAPLLDRLRAWVAAGADTTLVPAVVPAGRAALANRTWGTLGNRPDSVDPEQDPTINPAFPGRAPWNKGGFAQIMAAWSGGYWDEPKQKFGITGEGHTDGASNARLAIATDDADQRWVLEKKPAGCIGNEGDLLAGESSGVYFGKGSEPRANHTYNNLTVDRDSTLWMLTGSTYPNDAGGGHLFRAVNGGEWEHMGTPGAGFGTPHGGLEYDSKRHRLMLTTQSNGPIFLYDIATGKWSTSKRWTGMDGYSRPVYLPRLDVLVLLSRGYPNRIGLYDMERTAGDGVLVQPPTSGPVPDLWGFSGVYVPRHNVIAAWHGGTGFDILTPPTGDPMTSTWTWSRLEADAKNTMQPAPAQLHGTFGRLFWSEKKGMFGVANAVDRPMDVFAWDS